MGITVTHAKVSVDLGTPPDPTLIAGTDWNATHTISGQAERLPAQAGTVSILSTDIEVAIDTSGGAVTVNLPSASAWAAANPFGNQLEITDLNGHAGSNNITPALNGADTFRGGVTPVITTNYGRLALRPAGNPVAGWRITGLN